MEHAWEAGAGAEVEGMWHYGSADDAAGLVDAKKGQLEGKALGIIDGERTLVARRESSMVSSPVALLQELCV